MLTLVNKVAGQAVIRGAGAIGFALDQVEGTYRGVTSLPASLRSVNDVVGNFGQTIARLDEFVRRLDQVVEPLERPLAEIGPRLEALLPLLDAELLEGAADALAALRTDALPALAGAAATQEQVAAIAASIDRLMNGLEETVTKLGELPGAGLLTRRLGRASQPSTTIG